VETGNFSSPLFSYLKRIVLCTTLKRRVYILLLPLCLVLTGESLAKTSGVDNIEAYKQAVMMGPNDARAHYNFGVALGNSGMYTEAIKSYKKVIRINFNGGEQ
jgi:tetratricopeptide (TPR) repeat protein